MNDRFRYRVWDKTQNKWLHFDFSTYPTYQDRIWQALTDGETFYQCTGLKDKNGKLIYEGDIVKIGNGSINGSVIETTREVKWTINTWNVPVWVVDKPNFSHYVEVIGNIFENKELLEDTDER